MESKWIGHNDFRDKRNVILFFRKEYEKKDEKVKINISANQSYKLYLDGRFVQRGTTPFAEQHPVYDEFELFPDNNKFCLAIEIYSMGKETKILTEQNKGETGLWFQLIIGNKIYEGDESVKCIASPSYFREECFDPMANRISFWGGYKHIENSNFEILDWKKCGFDDSTWKNAVEIQNNFGKLKKREIKFLTEYIVPFEKVLEVQKNLGNVKQEGDQYIFDCSTCGSFPSIIFDFGKEVVGYTEIEIQGEKDSNCSLWYGESLDLYRIDTLILNGKKQSFSPYGRRAFRYLKVSANGSSVPIVLSKMKFIMTHYPVINQNDIQFNDKNLQNILETSLHTTKLAMQNHFEDSVFREQMQWLLDARIISLVNYAFYKEYDYSLKSIRQFAQAQRMDGAIPAAGPQGTTHLIPDFCMHYILMVNDYEIASNKLVDKEIMDVLKMQMEWFSVAECDDGLISIDGKKDWWCFVDWAFIDRQDKVTSLNCLYFLCIKTYAEILKRHNIENKFYLQKAERLKEIINQKMFNLEKELYSDSLIKGKQSDFFSQQTNIYAVLSEVSTDEKLLEKIFSDDFDGTKVNGAFMMCLTVETLLNHNKIKIAKKLIDNYWGEMLRRGATTWWETFDMQSGKSTIPYAFSKNNPVYMNECVPVSHCHAWGAGIAYSLLKYKNLLDI